MQYGFLIDHRSCIGCHACTVACKAENDVPVGSFRTWVKYVEKGRFPDVRRHFGVLRCNHCTSAPCVTICPVTALDKRQDGIVDIDRDVCIGCRACMQACPYDAIYLNEDMGAVEKCHFCAHRVEQNLEPACVIVCPEKAIVYGDLQDPKSRISHMVEERNTEVRRPEQGTGPNVHYVGHESSLLHPGATEQPETYLWSNRPPEKPEPWPAGLPVMGDTKTVLDTGHKVEWGWPVALYLVTKGIAAGAAMLAPFVAQFGLTGFAANWLPEILALVFVTITTIFLVEDLTRPKLFLTLLTRGNRKSWLVKGAYILIAFSTTVTMTLASQWMGWEGLVGALRWVNAILGLGVAGYTAFLFGQCQGRNLWQSRALLPHLLLQALLCGSACLLPFAPDSLGLRVTFLAAALGHLLFALAERLKSHPTDNGRQAAAYLATVRWGGMQPYREGLLIGGVLAALLALWAPALALVAVLFGLCLYEWAFVRAGQLPPLS